MTSPICPRCGKELPPNSTTCPHCRFALEFAPTGTPVRTTPKWVWWVVGFAAVGVLACGGLVVAFVFVLPRAAESYQLAQRAQAQSDMHLLLYALEEYAVEHGGTYPDSLEKVLPADDAELVIIPDGHLPLDPWGRDYVYDPPTQPGAKPRLRSLGADGEPGGEGEDADVDNESIRDDP